MISSGIRRRVIPAPDVFLVHLFPGVFHGFPEHSEDLVPVISDLGVGNTPFFCDGMKGDLFFSAGVFYDQSFVNVCQAAGQRGGDFPQSREIAREVFAEGVRGGRAEFGVKVRFAVPVVIDNFLDAQVIVFRPAVCQYFPKDGTGGLVAVF